MDLMDYLDRLRARPERERRQIALWFSIAVTGMIALIWVLVANFFEAGGAGAAGPVSEIGWWDSHKLRIIEGWKIIKTKI